MVSPAEQSNSGYLNETPGISKILPEGEERENKTTPFFNDSPQQPGRQAVSRAASPDLMSWCSDELRAVKKEKAMRSDLSIGAHHPGTSSGNPLGPVSSWQPYSRVSRWEK
ncbi:pre-mRNA splicing factor [Aspergillus luchuensis]|uniref:Pre-mRNA splicing factor n=1 Tax=Aspergillus kawachii TaxID=1069201 RepID=A0A146G0M7_ASPKA|nr:pre-mRNA splicing factor [Aspergillus luchuensis]